MKYLCLIYLDETAVAALPPAEADALWGRAAAFATVLEGKGRCLAAEALEPTRAAITLRRRSGQLSTTDGPSTQTNEQLTGFALIDADNLDDAIALASKMPAARLGSVEVRPVR